MNTAYIGFGSNLGDSLRILQDAWKRLGQQPDIEIDRLSSPYRSEPVGMKSNNWFVNGAGSVVTTLEPLALLDCLLEIEKFFGRKRDRDASGYQDRTLDFDLLLYNNRILHNNRLTIPHPEIQHRLFVLYPLCEIAPDYSHPLLHRTVRSMVKNLETKVDQPVVQKISWPDIYG